MESYLRKINIDDLMLFKKEPKSSKKLEGGPKVDGNQANSGQIRKGYSVPAEIATNLDKVYGASSFHNKNYTAMKEILENTHLKESLLEKVKRELAEDFVEVSGKK